MGEQNVAVDLPQDDFVQLISERASSMCCLWLSAGSLPHVKPRVNRHTGRHPLSLRLRFMVFPDPVRAACAGANQLEATSVSRDGRKAAGEAQITAPLLGRSETLAGAGAAVTSHPR